MESNSSDLLFKKLILLTLLLILSCLVLLLFRIRPVESGSAAKSVTDDQIAARPPIPQFKRFGPPVQHASPVPSVSPALEVVETNIPIPEAITENVAEPPLISAPPTATFVAVAVPRADPLASAGRTAFRVVLTGEVLLSGTPPPETPIQLDSTCRLRNPKPITTRHYLVSPEGALADVLVYLKGVSPLRFVPSQETALLTINKCFFEPYVSAILVNQTLQLQNRDRSRYAISATVTNPANRGFEFQLQFEGTSKQTKFAGEELFVRIKSDTHPWMFAYVAVMTHPFFAVTGPDGRFTITADLPAGNYVLAARHRKAGETAAVVGVTESGELRYKLTLQAGQITQVGSEKNASRSSRASVVRPRVRSAGR